MSAYSPSEHRPLRGFLALLGAFHAAAGAAAAVGRRRGRRLPERWDARDIVLTGVATQKLSRLIAKDEVFSPLRAPFTRYQGPAGQGEVSEEARGAGLRLALGELLICPYCVGMWVAAGFTGGLVLAPRPTRMAAATFAALAVSDGLQLAYGWGKEQLG